MNVNNNVFENVKNDIIKLNSEGKTNAEIAEQLKMSKTTIRKYCNLLGLEINSKKTKLIKNKNINLTDFQLQVLYGSLLGDMYIEHRNGLSRPCIGQGGNQEDYFDYKYNIFKGLVGKPYKKQVYDKRTCKYYNKFTSHFLFNEYYNDLYSELYVNGVKTITQQYLDKLTPISLAFWFMDDGCNCGTLATNCFSLSECKLIQNWLKSKYQINTTLHKVPNNQYVVYIKKSSRKTFANIVKDYFIESMMYKIRNWLP